MISGPCAPELFCSELRSGGNPDFRGKGYPLGRGFARFRLVRVRIPAKKQWIPPGAATPVPPLCYRCGTQESRVSRKCIFLLKRAQHRFGALPRQNCGKLLPFPIKGNPKKKLAQLRVSPLEKRVSPRQRRSAHVWWDFPGRAMLHRFPGCGLKWPPAQGLKGGRCYTDFQNVGSNHGRSRGR